MEAVKFISFDFSNRVITVMNESDIPQEAQTNLCIGPEEVYMLECYAYNNHKLYIVPDTGDLSFGKLFNHVLPLIGDNQKLEIVKEKLRWGGAGGYSEIAYSDIIDLPLTIEDKTILIPRIPILLEETPDYLSGYDGAMGIETFKLWGKVSFDLQRMIMYPSK